MHYAQSLPCIVTRVGHQFPDTSIFGHLYLLNCTCKFFQIYTHYKGIIDVQIKKKITNFLKQDQRSYELTNEASEVT